MCKGRWLEIRRGLKSCYAQWEDVGPFRTDSAGYVFGNERPPPNANRGAGIDVSPAVRDYLGLGSLDVVDFLKPHYRNSLCSISVCGRRTPPHDTGLRIERDPLPW